MSRTQQLAQRRAMLVAECALQRTLLQVQSKALGEATGWIKTSHSIVDRLKNVPGWASALMAVLVVLVPGRAVTLARNGLLLWQLWRTLVTALADNKSDQPE